MKLFLILENGDRKEFEVGHSIPLLIRAIKQSDVETIVVGDVKDGDVLWEKQFKAVTVMPRGFGERQ